MFTPVIPSGGVTGWAFLNRTLDAQKKTYIADDSLKRDADYFRKKIGTVKTAAALVSDRRLLSVALTAFGMEDEINNKALLVKVLEGGTLDNRSLANRFADKRFYEFSKAFGFGDFPVPNTGLSDFADKIIAQYDQRRFENAVGEQDGDMRLALTARRELSALARRKMSGDAKWFTALGSAPLRKVLQTALGLPSSFTRVNLDKQLVVLKARAEQRLGSADLSALADPVKLEGLVRMFLTRSELQSTGLTNGGAVAARLLLPDQPGQGQLSRYV